MSISGFNGKSELSYSVPDSFVPVRGYRWMRLDHSGGHYRLMAVNNGFVYIPQGNVAKCEKTKSSQRVPPNTEGASPIPRLTYVVNGVLAIDPDPASVSEWILEKYDHDAPQMDCTCGFWAYYTLEEAFKNYKDIIGFPQDKTIVLAALDAYGRITVGEKGYRAGQADIIGVCEIGLTYKNYIIEKRIIDYDIGFEKFSAAEFEEKFPANFTP